MPSTKKEANPPIHSLDSLLFRFLKGQKVVELVPEGRAEEGDGTTSANAFVLAREIEQWMFGTVEGRLWATKRLSQATTKV